MIFSNNINFINSNPVSYLNTKKNTTDTNKTTGFDSYLAAHVSSAKSDATPDVNENTIPHEQSYSHSSPNKDDTTGGLRYLTVRDGQKVYTYIVIGKNFQILIGIDNEEEEEEADKQNGQTVDGKTVDDAKETNGFGEAADFNNLGKPSADKQSKVEKQMGEPDFMTDTSMFALTGYYQKKMREVLKEMQENLGDGKPINAKTSIDIEEKKMN